MQLLQSGYSYVITNAELKEVYSKIKKRKNTAKELMKTIIPDPHEVIFISCVSILKSEDVCRSISSLKTRHKNMQATWKQKKDI